MAQAKRRARPRDRDVPHAPPPERLALSQAEAAYLLGCSVPQIRNLLARGVLPRTRIGHAVKISRAAIDDFVARGGVEVVATRNGRAPAK